MKKFVCYNATTGHIRSSVTAAAASDVFRPDGYSVVEDVWGAVPGMHYWDGSQPQEMQELSDVISLDQSTIDPDLNEVATFTGVPAGTTVDALGPGDSVIGLAVEDGELVFDSDLEGTHYITFTNPQYKQWADVKIEVL